MINLQVHLLHQFLPLNLLSSLSSSLSLSLPSSLLSSLLSSLPSSPPSSPPLSLLLIPTSTTIQRIIILQRQQRLFSPQSRLLKHHYVYHAGKQNRSLKAGSLITLFLHFWMIIILQTGQGNECKTVTINTRNVSTKCLI